MMSIGAASTYGYSPPVVSSQFQAAAVSPTSIDNATRPDKASSDFPPVDQMSAGDAAGAKPPEEKAVSGSQDLEQQKRAQLADAEAELERVTQEEISAEIDRMAKRFKLGREQWLDLLERERGIGREEYVRDILWPTLALRKLAADQLTVTEDELTKAHEMRYGPAVHARLLVVSSRAEAEEIHAQLAKRPEEFARLAMKHSEDVNSASIGGLIQPIRRHMGDASLEQAVFSLEPGQESLYICC